jgi:hypothetical protein
MSKQAKAEVNYRRADDRTRRCGTCRHYEIDGRCDQVEGRVDADDVCDEYEEEP